MNSLKDDPISFKYKNTLDGHLHNNFYNVHFIVHQMLYNPIFYPLIPWLIKGIEERNKDIFNNLIPQVEDIFLNYSDAMFLTVLKYDNRLILSD